MENFSALQQLKTLIAKDKFHHATFRCQGTVWEGIWFYKKSDSEKAFRGFEVAGCVNKSDKDYEEAYKILAGKGMSVGSYGEG